MNKFLVYACTTAIQMSIYENWDKLPHYILFPALCITIIIDMRCMSGEDNQ